MLMSDNWLGLHAWQLGMVIYVVPIMSYQAYIGNVVMLLQFPDMHV